MRYRGPQILAIVLSLGWFTASASANLLQNATLATSQSCNTTAFNSSFLTASDYPNDMLPCDWLINGPADVSNINAIPQSSSDVPTGLTAPANYTGNYVAFAGGTDGSNPAASQDCLDELITAVPGDKYTISFYAAVVGPNPGNAFLTFEWDGNGGNSDTIQPVFNVHQTPDTSFEFFSFNFTFSSSDPSGSNNDRVYFHGADLDQGTGATNNGNFVIIADPDIELDSAAPEPASLLLIGSGLAMVGCLRFRKQRLTQRREQVPARL